MSTTRSAVSVISLYTLPNCIEADETRAALSAHGLTFTERSAQDQSPPTSPVVALVVQGEMVAWTGHRPDLIDLLADLIAYGPVPRSGLGDRELADDAIITRLQAIAQIERHQLNAGEFFAEFGNHPLYRGASLLDWLGY